MIRAFLAIEVPPEISTALATIQQTLKRQLERTCDRQARISWVRPVSMHLTLKFLGDATDESIEPLRVAIKQVVSAHQAIPIPLERLGTFPGPQAPRVLWVGPSGSWEQGREALRLTALHREVDACCRAANFAPEERPFSPHFT
ncbi:MAG: RNA 2',3'-cyclic phosphodiesterase, partial [Nitrospira sp.]